MAFVSITWIPMTSTGYNVHEKDTQLVFKRLHLFLIAGGCWGQLEFEARFGRGIGVLHKLDNLGKKMYQRVSNIKSWQHSKNENLYKGFCYTYRAYMSKLHHDKGVELPYQNLESIPLVQERRKQTSVVVSITSGVVYPYVVHISVLFYSWHVHGYMGNSHPKEGSTKYMYIHWFCATSICKFSTYWADWDRLCDVVDHGLVPIEVLPELGRHHRHINNRLGTVHIDTALHRRQPQPTYVYTQW